MKRPALSLNPAVREMAEATSIYINQLVYDRRNAGEDVITLSLGEAFFDIPAEDFTKLDFNKSYHYSESRGLLELRQHLARYYQTHYGAGIDAQHEMLISAGSKIIIFMAMMAALAPGDEILIPEPAWLSYPRQAEMVGAVTRSIPYDCPPENYKDYFTAKTRMLVICNPNNPAGRAYAKDELHRVYEDCRSRGVWLLVDEAYSDFVLDEPYVSAATLAADKDGVIVVNSLSKNLGLSGWRIGYVISSRDFIDQMLKVNQHLITCAPTILLMYCNTFFDEMVKVVAPQVRKVVEKRKRVAKMIHDTGLTCLPGGSTFYFFVSIGNYPGTSDEFALSLLLDHKVAVVPGSAYGESTDRFIRVAVGTESEERIQQALTAIHRLSKANMVDRERLQSQMSAFVKAAGLTPCHTRQTANWPGPRRTL